MLAKCANPSCFASFLYLHSGKLFRVDVENARDDGGPGFGADPAIKMPARRTEFFWLCEDCSLQMTLRFKKGSGVVTEPLTKTKATALGLG